MKNRISVLLVVVLLSLPVIGQAQQMFDGAGQALVPDQTGGHLMMYSVIRDGAPAITTPIPLDFDNYEYTMVIMSLELVGTTPPFGTEFANGAITIFEDNGTAADWADPTTFVDGTAILMGTIHTLSRRVYPTGVGTAASETLDWTGGTRVNEMAPEDQIAWRFFSGINTTVDVEPGYDENWDCKAEPEEPIVDTETMIWGSLKAMW